MLFDKEARSLGRLNALQLGVNHIYHLLIVLDLQVKVQSVLHIAGFAQLLLLLQQLLEPLVLHLLVLSHGLYCLELLVVRTQVFIPSDQLQVLLVVFGSLDRVLYSL